MTTRSRGWTYSVHKPSVSITDRATASDKLFDHIVVSEQNVPGKRIALKKKQQQKETKILKRSRKGTKKCQETSPECPIDSSPNDQTSICLFQDENKYQGNKTRSKKSRAGTSGMQWNKRKARAQKETEQGKLLLSTIEAESHESGSNLIIEESGLKQVLMSARSPEGKDEVETSLTRNPHDTFSSKNKLLRNVRTNNGCGEVMSAPQGGDPSASQVSTGKENISDVEKARDISNFSASRERGLVRSPVIDLMPSDEDSPVRSGKLERTGTSELGWVTISSKAPSSCSWRTGTDGGDDTWCGQSSKYTYTYISTYTDSTTSDTVCTKTSASSPPVKMKKLPAKLNSTTCRGKDSIGAVEFPDCLSPVCQSQNELTIQTKGLDLASATRRSHKDRSSKTPRLNQCPPKCSTVLFLSQPPSTSHLGSVSLTTIHGSDANTPVVPEVRQGNSPAMDTELSLCKNQQESVDLHISPKQNPRPAQHLLRASTPQVAFQAMSFSISPIGSPSFAQDELPVNHSIEVNSEEIIVPSLMEPSDLSVNSKLDCEGNDSPARDCDKCDRDRCKQSENSHCETGDGANTSHTSSAQTGTWGDEPRSGRDHASIARKDFSLPIPKTNVSVNISGNPQVFSQDEMKRSRGRSNQTVSAAVDRNPSCSAIVTTVQKDVSSGHTSDTISCNLLHNFDDGASVANGKQSSCHQSQPQKSNPVKSKKYFTKDKHDKFIGELCNISTENHDRRVPGHGMGVAACEVEHIHVKSHLSPQEHPASRDYQRICFINRICMQSQRHLKQRNSGRADDHGQLLSDIEHHTASQVPPNGSSTGRQVSQ